MSLVKPIGVGLSLGPLSFPLRGRLANSVALPDSGPSEAKREVDISPPLDFTLWENLQQSPMSSMDGNTFTNGGTGYLQYDTGAIAGNTYIVHIDQTRGEGTCLIYFAADADTDREGDIWGLEGGAESITLVAEGPWLTFRASVGATTTTVHSLTIEAVDKPVAVSTDAEIQGLVSGPFSGGVDGVLYSAMPVVNGQQVLFQDTDGTVPVQVNGDPVALIKDVSGNGHDLTAPSSSARMTYRTNGKLSWLTSDGIDDQLSDGGSLSITGSTASYMAVAMQSAGTTDVNDGMLSYTGLTTVNNSSRAVGFENSIRLKVDTVNNSAQIEIPDISLKVSVYEGSFGSDVKAGMSGDAWLATNSGAVDTVAAASRLGIGIVSGSFMDGKFYGGVHIVKDVTDAERQAIVAYLKKAGGAV